MDFFSEQEKALRSSKRLVLLFALALITVIGMVYAIVVYLSAHHPVERPILWWDPQALLWTSLSVSALIGGGSLYKIARLANNGGVAIALSLGGEPVSRDTADRLERRLLNVVDEMAIASGVPVPQVYVLTGEAGINAFAAGHDFQDAVIAVTRGALEKLSRDELQGVVAHEFSHIFHGDMRLNLRLVGLLYGILLVALVGRYIMKGGMRGRSKNSGSIALLGLAFLLVGYLGVLFARLIKAAVSRQREFLADASAVQYTRNPAGIGGALKKIAGIGADISHPAAEEASHMFFGNGHGFGAWFSTHPPIEERIARIDPAYRALVASGKGGGEAAPEGLAMGFAAAAESVPVSPGGVLGSIGNVDARHVGHAAQVIGRLSGEIREALNSRTGAECVIYGLLVASDEAPETVLGAVVDDPDKVSRALEHARWLSGAGRDLWLPVVELAIPTLQTLDSAALNRVIDNVNALAGADGRLSLFEFAVISVLRHALGEERPGRTHVDVPSIRGAVALLLSVLVHAGHAAGDEARIAFERAAEAVPLDGPWIAVERNKFSLNDLDGALGLLGGLKLGFKRKLIEACVVAIAVDGRVTVAEAELLRAFGARLDCPVPLIVPGALEQGQA